MSIHNIIFVAIPDISAYTVQLFDDDTSKACGVCLPFVVPTIFTWAEQPTSVIVRQAPLILGICLQNWIWRSIQIINPSNNCGLEVVSIVSSGHVRSRSQLLDPWWSASFPLRWPGTHILVECFKRIHVALLDQCLYKGNPRNKFLIRAHHSVLSGISLSDGHFMDKIGIGLLCCKFTCVTTIAKSVLTAIILLYQISCRVEHINNTPKSSA